MRKNLLFLVAMLLSFASYGQSGIFSSVKITSKPEKINDAKHVVVWDSIGKKLAYKIMPDAILAHNDLTGLQGGSVGQMYHLNSVQYDWVLSQLYVNHSATFATSTPSGERGVNIANTLNYNIASNDDVITSANINQSIGSVLANADTGSKSVSAPIVAETTVYTLGIGYTRNGIVGSQNRSATYTTYNPQWYGSSTTLEDITTSEYPNLIIGNGFTKIISSSNIMTYNANISTPAYVWFISPINTNKITASGFDTSIGTWGDGSSFFWKKSLAGFVLANGTTTATMYLYRTRLPQNTGGVVIPFVFNP